MPKLSGPEALQKIIDERKLKQSDVEKAVGVSVGTVSRWLGKNPMTQRSPGREAAVALERLYGIPVESWTSRATRAAS